MLRASGTAGNVFEFIFVLLIFAVVLALCLFTTKWIGRYQKQHLGNKNFKILESMKVGNGKYLALIEVGEGQFFVIALGKDEVTLIGRVDGNKLDLSSSDDSNGSAFSGFENYLKKFKTQQKTEEQ